MKRFILVLVDADEGEDLSPVTIQTDNVRESVKTIVNDLEYDIAAEIDDDGKITEPAIEEVIHALMTNKSWYGEDGAKSIILVDTQAIDYDTTVAG